MNALALNLLRQFQFSHLCEDLIPVKCLRSLVLRIKVSSAAAHDSENHVVHRVPLVVYTLLRVIVAKQPSSLIVRRVGSINTKVGAHVLHVPKESDGGAASHIRLRIHTRERAHKHHARITGTSGTNTIVTRTRAYPS